MGSPERQVGGQRELPEESTSFSPRLVDSLVDALLIVEDRGHILYANRAVEQLLGWKVGDLFGVPLVDLLPERFRESSLTLFLQWMATDPPPRSPAPSRIMMLCQDGSELPVDVGTFLVVPDEGSRMVVAALWDVSLRIDIDRYQRVADDLLTFLAGASGTAEEIVPQLLSILALSLDFDFATAWQWEEDSELLRCEHVWHPGELDCEALTAASTGMTVRAGQGLAGLVVSSNEPMWHADLTAAPNLRRHDAIVSDGMRSGFVFPIRTKERLIGVIELFTRASRRPDGPLLDAVAEVCSRLGELIERLDLEVQRNELLARLERSQKHQEFLLLANLALAGANDFHEAVRKLAELAVPMFGDICLIDVVGQDGSLRRMVARHADPAQQPLTDELSRYTPDIAGPHPAAMAVSSGRSQWSGNMGEDFMRATTEGDDHFELTRRLGFDSYVSVPLLVAGETIGALTVVTAGSGRQLGRGDLVLIEDLADHVAVVIQRARDFDVQAAIAQRLQASLLPSLPDRLPGVSIAARYVTGDRGAQVGGDFYDVVVLADDRVALVIGDVEGHDMTAATLMGQVRSAIRAYLLLADDPGAILFMLDRFVAEQPIERLVTAALIILDCRSGAVRASSAGHPPPVCSGDGRPTAPFQIAPGPPLGIGSGRYRVARFELERGSTLVLYTDGLIDEGRMGAPLLLRSLAQTLDEHGGGDAEELASAVLRALVPPDPVADDIALLIARWSGTVVTGEGSA